MKIRKENLIKAINEDIKGVLIEILISIVLGIVLGIFVGLFPGIHTNLISSLIALYLTEYFFYINPIYIVVLISAMAISNTFVNFIPSILLGCPDTDTELSTLPGHRLLKIGRGYIAIILTNYGGLAAILVLMIILIPAILLLPLFQALMLKRTPFIGIPLISLFLIFIISYMILLEKNKFSALYVFFITGILGLLSLGTIIEKTPFITGIKIKEPLLPLLTGLFGASGLIISLRSKTKIPKQKIIKSKIKKGFLMSPLVGSTIASSLSGFLPGLGSGQSAIIGSSFIKGINDEKFMVLLGATNTFVMGFSFIAFYLISKTRTGAVAAIEKIIGPLNLGLFLLIMFVIFLTGVLSFILIFPLARFFCRKISQINYSFISMIILLLLILIVTLFSGLKGLFLFLTSTLTGLYCLSFKVRRTNMMGCLLLPTILFYIIP